MEKKKKTPPKTPVKKKRFPSPDTIIAALKEIGVTSFFGSFTAEGEPEWVTVGANVSAEEVLGCSQYAYRTYEETLKGPRQ